MSDRIKEIRDNTETDAAFMDYEPECGNDHYPGCDCQVQRYIKEKFDLIREIDRLRVELAQVKLEGGKMMYEKDKWKTKAQKYEEAIAKIKKCNDWDLEHGVGCRDIRDILTQLLNS